MSRVAKADTGKWEELSGKCFKDQAIWALNGFWDKMEKDAELVWTWTQKMGELHQEKHAEGCDLDEFWSHKFLETLGETMTVIEMREKFRKIDADFNKRMSMLEYLMFRYSIEPHAMITAPQGGDQEQINKAQAMVDSAQKAVDAMNAALADAQKAVEAAVQAEKENKAALDELVLKKRLSKIRKLPLKRPRMILALVLLNVTRLQTNLIRCLVKILFLFVRLRLIRQLLLKRANVQQRLLKLLKLKLKQL